MLKLLLIRKNYFCNFVILLSILLFCLFLDSFNILLLCLILFFQCTIQISYLFLFLSIFSIIILRIIMNILTITISFKLIPNKLQQHIKTLLYTSLPSYCHKLHIYICTPLNINFYVISINILYCLLNHTGNQKLQTKNIIMLAFIFICVVAFTQVLYFFL